MARKTAKTAKTAKIVRPDAKDGKYLATAREAGISWGEILDATGAASAIPLRVTLRAYLVSDPEGNAKRFPREFAKVDYVEPTAANVVRLRDKEGAGFPLIAARTGLSTKEVIGLYAKGEGASLSGRVYAGAAGSTLLSPDGSTRRLDAPAKKGKKGKGKKTAAKTATAA
jgi:hypothetical protein